MYRVIYKNEDGDTKATASMTLDEALNFQDALLEVRGLAFAEVVTILLGSLEK